MASTLIPTASSRLNRFVRRFRGQTVNGITFDGEEQCPRQIARRTSSLCIASSLTPSSRTTSSLTPTSTTPSSTTPSSLAPFSLTPSSLTPSSFTPSFMRQRKRQKTHHQVQHSHSESLALLLSQDAKVVKSWDEALQNRSVTEVPEEKMRALVRAGVPMKYRIQMWQLLPSKTSKHHLRYFMESGDVALMQKLAKDDAVIRIAQDLPRTHPGQLDASQLLSLKNVLTAYAAWNPQVGYCQGLNFVAAVFIRLGFEEAGAVMGMRYLVEEVCRGCHEADLNGYHRDADVLDKLVQQFLPGLHAKLRHGNVPVSLLAIDHFVSLASRNWPLEATVRLWDLIFLEGPPALFASFLALLELFVPVTGDSADEEDMTATDIMESFKLKSTSGLSGDVTDALFAVAHKYLEMIPRSLIETMRNQVVNSNAVECLGRA